MKGICALAAVVFGFTAVAATLTAQAHAPAAGSAAAATTKPRAARTVRAEILQVIRHEAAQISVSTKPAAMDLPDDVLGEPVIMLDPVVVEGPKVPDLSRPRENRVQEFFRTGTIKEQVGPRITRRLWVRGDKGVMLSFSW